MTRNRQSAKAAGHRWETNCLQCGAQMDPRPPGRGTTVKRFCSVVCKQAANNVTRRVATTVTCADCGESRTLMNARSAGEVCRTCAAKIASVAAAARARPSVKERLLANVRESPSGCWIWTGTTQINGYGAMVADGKIRRTHRISYEMFVGPIPDGLHIDHLCRVRACCNPQHLEPVTPLENARRAMRAACVNGHEFTPKNTYKPKDGKRYCRTCRRERQQAKRSA